MGAEVREHPAGIEGFRAQLTRDFDQEIATTDCRSLVVSDEHFHSALITRDEIDRLHGFLARVCRKCQVVVYLRRQDELSRSFHCEQIKIGRSGDGELFPPQITYYYDYRSLIENYESVFGPGTVTVRRFEPARMANADVIDDFAALIGLGDVYAGGRGHPDGTSPWNGLALALPGRTSIATSRKPSTTGPTPDRLDLRPLLEATYPGEGWPVSRQKAIDYYRMFASINEWVRQRFFPTDATLFQEDFSRYPTSDTDQPASFGDAVAAAAMLWQHQARALRATQAEIARLRLDLEARHTPPTE